MDRLSHAWLWCLIAMLIGAGCTSAREPGTASQSPTAQAAIPKRLVAAIKGNPGFISYSLNSGGGGRIDGATELSGLTSSGLSVLGPTGAAMPVLSEQLPPVENGLWVLLPDGRMETTWRIRDGARWHDGTAFTADDVVFTSQLARDPEMPWIVDRIYPFIEKVEAPDPRTLRVTWKEPYIRADQVPFDPPYPRHLLERPYQQQKDSIAGLSYWNSDFVGTGPFKVREFVRDSHVMLAAFDDYVFGRPKVDEIQVKFIPDENALAANLLAASVDFTLGPGLTVEEAIQVRDRWADGKMRTGPSGWININPQFLNPDPPILANLSFRRALYMAIDRPRLVDALTLGLSEVAHSSINPAEPEYRSIESSIVRWEYEPRRSAQMIEELGYQKGSDGMFMDSAGKALSVQIMATQDDANAKPQFAVLDMWKTIGITPDVEVVTTQRQRDLSYRATFRNFSLQAGFGYGPDGMNSLLTREARIPERNYIGNNYTRYMNPEIDGLVDRYFTTIPFGERMQVLARLVRHTTDNVIWMPLYWRVLPTLTNDRVVGVQPLGEGNQWADAYQWDLK